MANVTQIDPVTRTGIGVGKWRPQERKRIQVTTLPLAELVEDMDVYPRHAIDPAHVQSIAYAIEAGSTLPPIVADKKSKRIVDGWHRGRAYKRVLGPEGVVDVELVAYPDEASLIYDAVCRNAAHGRKLDAIDRTRSILMLEKHGIATIKIAVAMNLPESRVVKLAVRVAHGKDGSVPGTRKIVLKRPVAHMKGQTLTKEQAAVHTMLPGTSFLLIAKQLRSALEVDLVNLEDERLVAELKTLRDVLTKTVA